jgi:hypothetical protein
MRCNSASNGLVGFPGIDRCARPRAPEWLTAEQNMSGYFSASFTAP